MSVMPLRVMNTRRGIVLLILNLKSAFPFEYDNYPDDYPELGSEIVIHGTFNTYEDETGAYVQLKDAVME